ncbi:MAG: hypothetical protein AAF564_11595 [Bacteroidota bacterium]
MSLFSYISINPFELGYEEPGMIRESTDIFCFVNQRSGRIFSGSNALGEYIHARLSPAMAQAIMDCGWLVELTPKTIKSIDPEILKNALFEYWSIFDELIAVDWDIPSTQAIEEPLRTLLLDDHGNPSPTVEELRALHQNMFTNMAGGVFICEKAIRQSNTVCVVLG